MNKTQEQEFLDSLPDSENDFLGTIPDADIADSRGSGFADKAARFIGESLSLPIRGYRGVGVGLERYMLGDSLSKALERSAEATKPGYVPPEGERLGSAIGTVAPTGPLGVGGAALALGGSSGAEKLAEGKSIGEASNTAARDTMLNLLFGKAAESGVPMLTKALKGTPTKLSELLTNVRANKFGNVIDNPKAILPESMGGAVPMVEAKAGYVGAAEKAGFIKTPEAATDSALSQFVGQKNPFKGNNEVAASYFDRMANGEKLTPDELFHFYQNVGEKIRPLNVNTPRGAKAINVRAVLKEELSKLSPEWKKAADVYEESATKSSTTSLYPKTDTGRPAFGRMFGGTTAGGIVGHDPVSLLLGAAAVSPVVHTLAYASAGTGLKALDAVLKTPGANTMILTALQSILRGVDKTKQPMKKDPDIESLPSEVKATKGDIPTMDEKDVHDFVIDAPAGTRFRFNGSDKIYKVVPRKERTYFPDEQSKKDYEKSRRFLGAYRTKTFTLA